MKGILPSHPENYRQLIRRSLKLYNASFNHVFFLALFLGICIFIPRLISDIVGKDIFIDLPLFSPFKLFLFLIGLLSLIFFIAIVWRMHCVNRGYHEPLAEDFTVGLKKVLYVFVASLLQCLILVAVSIGILAFEAMLQQYHLLFPQNLLGFILIFGIFFGQFFLILYISTLFVFLIPLIAIENQSILASLERSIYLVWDHWWRVFSVQMTPWLCYLIFFIILRFILNIDIHIYFVGISSHLLWTTLLQFLIFILFIPWVAALLLVQLKDLELRKHIRQPVQNEL